MIKFVLEKFHHYLVSPVVLQTADTLQVNICRDEPDSLANPKPRFLRQGDRRTFICCVRQQVNVHPLT